MMRNKTLHKLLLIFSLIFITSYAFARDHKQYNIYLIPANTADNYIKSFDKSLEKTGILEKYKVTPFIVNHPVHLTLYLTSFESKYITDIENQLAKVAKSTSPFYINTANFTAGKSGFVMLNIQNSQTLQNLSNKVIESLVKYRNKDYDVPSWVKYYPSKLESFKKYGSPNAFNEFNPHLNILAANLQTDEARTNFEKDFNQIIKNNSLKLTNFKIKAIGFGEVDKYGQVIKPLHIYKLNG